MNIAQSQIGFFQNELKHYVLKRVKDRALAEDIVQEVFIKVQTKYHQLADHQKLTNWIYQIAQNTITDFYRSKSKEILVNDIDWESDDKSLNACVETCLKDMLQTLPHHYREALELVELENLSQHALANRLGISYSGAKSRVQRARLMLKEQMDNSYLIRMDSYGNVVTCENRVPCNCAHTETQN